ncbi:MAG: hypothetical protein AAB262_07680 [Elusimicrobiota bacterium]
MKLGRRFKALLLGTSAVLYATGLAAWALGWERFKTDHGLGPEPSPLRPAALHAHAVAGLLFLILCGYLWRAHVEPGLDRRKKRRLGPALLCLLAVLFLTTPLIFYLNDAQARAWAGEVHAWAGALVLAPFLAHLRAKPR